MTSRPSLLGTNVVTLSGDLSQDASELLRRSVLAGGLPMTATYQDLTYVARIPAITVEIHGDRSAFLSETIKKYQVTHSQLNSTTVDLGFIEWTRSYWSSWTENHSTLSEFSSETQTITMKVDAGDFRTSPEATAALAKFEEMALNIFSTNVVPSIMRDVSAQFQAAKDALNGPADTPPPPTQISTLTQSITGSVDLNLSKSAVIQVRKNPNGRSPRPDRRRDQVRGLLRGPVRSVLQGTPVRVQANVNFERDPVFRLTVSVLTTRPSVHRANRKGTKTLLFDSADQVQSFRQILARARTAPPSTATGTTRRSSTRRPASRSGCRPPAAWRPVRPNSSSPTGTRLRQGRHDAWRRCRRRGGVRPGAVHYPESTRPSATQTFDLTARPHRDLLHLHRHRPGDGDPPPYP